MCLLLARRILRFVDQSCRPKIETEDPRVILFDGLGSFGLWVVPVVESEVKEITNICPQDQSNLHQ